MDGRLALLCPSSEDELVFLLKRFLLLSFLKEVTVTPLSDDSVEDVFALNEDDGKSDEQEWGNEIDLFTNLGRVLEAGFCHFESASTLAPNCNFFDSGMALPALMQTIGVVDELPEIIFWMSDIVVILLISGCLSLWYKSR